jgi:hypothetical protein
MAVRCKLPKIFNPQLHYMIRDLVTLTYQIKDKITNKLINKGKLENVVCQHPKRQRGYYNSRIYKCWECKKIIVTN